MKYFIYFVLALISLHPGDDIRFLSYNSIPTWSGILVDLKSKPKIHLYDSDVYKGHSEFVSKSLGRNIRFEEFKNLCKFRNTREYLPFFLYDLSSKPYKNKKGELFNWAIRLENYSYTDSPEEMISEILKLNKMILEIDKSFSEKGLIILSKEKNSPLNFNRLEKSLSSKNETSITLDTLIQFYGAKKTLILNSGIAIGKLVRVKTETELQNLKPNDIPILEFIPIQIPNVAGIITLEPQSPLSHINLLAKNRNIFNAYIQNMESIPNLKKLMGQNVKLYSEKEKIYVRKVSKVETLKKNQIPKIEIQSPELDLKEIISLKSENEKLITVNKIGSKAKNYFLLFDKFPEYTRPAFAVSFYFYFQSIQNEPETLIKSFLQNEKSFSKKEKIKSLEKIREIILTKGKVPQELILSLKKTLKDYPPKTKFRLRSSTNAEDLPQFNGAGLYESKSFSKEDEDSKIEAKILEVYSSLWNEKAFFEREYFKIDHKKLAIGILIHESFKKESANGVILFSKKKNKTEILVSSQIGEIEVVRNSKGIIPETILLNGEDCKIEKIITESSISPVFIDVKQNNSILNEICKSSSLIHSEFIKRTDAKTLTEDFGIDIEFKILTLNSKNKLFYKQVRAIRN